MLLKRPMLSFEVFFSIKPERSLKAGNFCSWATSVCSEFKAKG
jgi:hypothetical protein